MLVLSRKLQQSVQIGCAVVTVVEISGNRVRLGVAAPEEIKILRQEIVPTNRIAKDRTALVALGKNITAEAAESAEAKEAVTP